MSWEQYLCFWLDGFIFSKTCSNNSESEQSLNLKIEPTMTDEDLPHMLWNCSHQKKSLKNMIRITSDTMKTEILSCQGLNISSDKNISYSWAKLGKSVF